MTLAAGERFPSAYLPHVFYQFPEFQEAKITWTDFSSARYPLKMNYNLFIGRMDVINENGDTVKQLTMLKLMPRDREKIIAFMNENNTSFNDAQDLMNLISYCNQLR